MLVVPLVASAQVEAGGQVDAGEQVDEVLEQWAAEGGEDGVEVYYDEMQELWERRVNLNDTAALVGIPILSSFQRATLKNYILLYGQLMSHKELALMPGFDSATIALLSELTVVEPYEVPKRFRLADGCNSLTTNLGGANLDSLCARMVYNYDWYGRINLRLAAEKDAFELWGKDNFFSYHLMFTNFTLAKNFTIERLILGRYNLQFGQGLTLWTGLAPFNMLGTSPLRFANGVRPASTFYEEGYQQGGALTIRLMRNWHLSAFASKTHGTSLLGSHAEFRTDNLSAGFTFTHTALDDSLKSTERIYNTNYFRGDHLTNIGIDFAWQWHRLIFYGEAAMDDSTHMAAIGGVKMMIDSRNTLGISYRHYDVNYHNLFAQPYAIGNSQNENGWTFDARCRLPFRLDALLSVDLHSFPSLRYASYRPSSGAWLRAQLSRELGRHVTASLRYAWRIKERNIPNIDSTSYLWEETVRRQLQAEIRTTIGRWQLITKGALAQFDSEVGDSQHGWILSQQARYTHGPLQATAGATIFNIDGYYARIYLSESNLQYSFSMPMYYGSGVRAFLVLRYHLTDGLDLAAKYTMFLRNDTPRHAATLQVRWKF